MTLKEFLKLTLLSTKIEIRSSHDDKLLFRSGSHKKMKQELNEMEVIQVIPKLRTSGPDYIANSYVITVLQISVRDYPFRKNK